MMIRLARGLRMRRRSVIGALDNLEVFFFFFITLKPRVE